MPPTPEPCRLYLILPEAAREGLADALAAALAVAEIASVLLPAPLARAPVAERLTRMAQRAGAAVLVAGDVETARALGADGAHVADPGAYDAARAALGPDAIVGGAAGFSRHAAMVLAEAGADYVALGDAARDLEATADLVAWWAELIETPCVAWNAEGVEATRELAGLGADFVAAGEGLWGRPDAAETARALAAAVAEARSRAA